MNRSVASTTGTALIPCLTRVAATSLRGAPGGTLTTGLLITSQVRMSSSSGGPGVARRDEVGGVDVVAAELTADQHEGVVGEVFGVVSAPWAGGHGPLLRRRCCCTGLGSSIDPGGGCAYGRRSRSSWAVRPAASRPDRR